MQSVPIRVDEQLSFRAHTTAIKVGEFLMISTGNDYKVVPMAAATDDATFVGISFSEVKTTEGADSQIQVMTKGLIRVVATSAIYLFGAGLKWASATSLVADADLNTIAWCYDDNPATRTSIIAYIDVTKQLGKLFDAMSA